ncbi:hypothetical protein BGZ59_009666 [Podila verticillata]|nr:hypothetical protein BGZ59_009666 [Podila verticillata]KFH72892.1 hypothetical protein MVEG_00117 [Podila verticillata NRRL 6337]
MYILRIRASDVYLDDHIVFDVMLSPVVDLERGMMTHLGVLAVLMKDIGTMDVALTFGIKNHHSNIALWVHRSIIAQQPGLSKLIVKLKEVERSSTDSAAIVGVQSYHVTDFSLAAYCRLIRFLYTTEIALEVDLKDFAIGYPPSKPLSLACKRRPDTDRLVPVLGRGAILRELFQLADCYQVQRLREFCRIQILDLMDEGNALDILFGYAYRYQDLKKEVLKYVASQLDRMFSGAEDPFEVFHSHPERHTLLAEALRIRFMTSVEAPVC